MSSSSKFPAAWAAFWRSTGICTSTCDMAFQAVLPVPLAVAFEAGAFGAIDVFAVAFFAGAFAAGAFLVGAFFAGAFAAGAFLVGAFFAAAFLTAAFLTAAFLTAAFLTAAFLTAAFFAGAFLTAAFFADAFFGGVATGVPFDGGPSVSPARADRRGVRVRIGTPDRIRTGVTTLKATRDSCEPVFECSRSSGGPGLFVLERESNASERTNTPGRTVGLEKAVLLCS